MPEQVFFFFGRGWAVGFILIFPWKFNEEILYSETKCYFSLTELILITYSWYHPTPAMSVDLTVSRKNVPGCFRHLSANNQTSLKCFSRCSQIRYSSSVGRSTVWIWVLMYEAPPLPVDLMGPYFGKTLYGSEWRQTDKWFIDPVWIVPGNTTSKIKIN